MLTYPNPVDQKRLYTSDEFEELDFPYDDNVYELIDGEIIMTPPPGDGQGNFVGGGSVRRLPIYRWTEPPPTAN